ncbi:hypothetical protein [Gordonia malaquae]|uniref:hypothetical protein n=1 Tax=Gordonia malaquae TaxID=410332 RepID=UPI003016226A
MTLDLQSVVGPIPAGDVPAAWWITTAPVEIAAYDLYRLKYADYFDNRLKPLMDELGVDTARTWRSPRGTSLKGFSVPRGMGTWPSHPDYRPVPDGWRIDKQNNLLVPIRRTKADRDSAANRIMKDLHAVPSAERVMSGLARELHLPGHLYWPHYLRGTASIIAYVGGDPDRADVPYEVDESIWTRRTVAEWRELQEKAS